MSSMCAMLKTKKGKIPKNKFLIIPFERDTKILEKQILEIKDPFAKKLLQQELDLRKRRLKQWKENPDGEPKGEPLQSVKDYLAGD